LAIVYAHISGADLTWQAKVRTVAAQQINQREREREREREKHGGHI